MSWDTGEGIAELLIASIPTLLGWGGLFLLIITPYYFVRTWKKRGNIVNPFVTLIFGIMFFVSWLYTLQ